MSDVSVYLPLSSSLVAYTPYPPNLVASKIRNEELAAVCIGLTQPIDRLSLGRHSPMAKSTTYLMWVSRCLSGGIGSRSHELNLVPVRGEMNAVRREDVR